MFSLQEILRHAVRDNRPDNRRRQQLRAILQKYCNLSANKEELAAHMKKRSLVSALCSSVRRTHHMVTSSLTIRTRPFSKAVSSSASRNCCSLKMPTPGLPRLKRPSMSCWPTIRSSPRLTSTASSIGSLAHVSTRVPCHGTGRPFG